MDWQFVVTALLVAGCTAHAAWTLMPRALRSACLARWRGTAAAAAARPACGGGCSGCGAGGAPAEAAQQPIRIVRPPRAGG